MTTKAGPFFSICALAACSVFAVMPGCSPPSTNRPTPPIPFDVGKHRYFSTYDSVVGSYLREHSPHRKARACVIGLAGAGYEIAWVIWRGGDRLVLWEENTEGLKHSRRELSLSEDVVATQAEIGTSTYLVDRQWVSNLDRQCVAFGRYVTVN